MSFMFCGRMAYIKDTYSCLYDVVLVDTLPLKQIFEYATEVGKVHRNVRIEYYSISAELDLYNVVIKNVRLKDLPV